MKAVLFDLDNTLLMKRPSVPEKWHEALAACGYPVSAKAAQRAFAACESWVGEQTQKENRTGVRMSDDDFLNGVVGCCIDALGIEASAFQVIAQVWMGRYEKDYALAEGALDLLESLSEKGIAMGIVSNNSPEIRRVLAGLGIDEYFKAIIISEEVNLYKPDPRILLYACEQLGVQPSEAVYVGDHPFDVVCAHEAGVCSAWIPVNEFMVLPQGVPEPAIRLSGMTDLLKQI